MRRHLTGIGLAIVMVLTMFLAGSWGYIRLLRLPVAANAPLSALPAGGGSLLGNTSVLSALAAVGGTAILAGILLVVPRVSALATGLPGLFALAWQALYLLDVHRALKVIPLRGHAFGAGWEAMLFNGILGAFGLAMIIPLFVPSRWRGNHRDADDEASGFMAELTGTGAGAFGRPEETPTLLAGTMPPGAGTMPGTATMPGAGTMPRTATMPRGPAPAPRGGPVPDGPPRAGGAPTSANPVPAGMTQPRIPRTGLVGGPPPGGPATGGGLISGDPRTRSRPFRRPDGL